MKLSYTLLEVSPEDLATLRMAVAFTLLTEGREKAMLARLGVTSPATNDRIVRLTQALEKLEEPT